MADANKSRKNIICILMCLVLFMFSGCSSSSSNSNNVPTDTAHEYSIDEIDFQEAESFERALNNKEDVIGKVVRFYVQGYEPESALGINCWAGEHLNFISKEELDVKEGEYITGIVTKNF